ncbi:MAG TPA: cation:proton antiporter, partial [Ignavibacteria bacterium]|nr:cation:proton antiporter [Ignavibacteria bacterium]
MIPLESILAIVSVLIIVSIIIARFTDNIGVPSLLLFLGVGMLAGSDGPGDIFFENIELAQAVGILALIFILFSGGLDTNWSKAKSASKDAILLATLGVLLTTAGVGLFAYYVLGFGLIEGLLLGSIISSTDAAAVFAVLRSRSVKLKGNLKPMLELESGSND